MNTTIILTLILSLVICLAGYKLNQVLIIIIAGIFGYYLGKIIIPYITLNDVLITLLPIICALIFAFIGFRLYLVGIFVLCFTAAYTVCYNIIDAENLKIISAVISLVIGLLAVKFTVPIMIVTTSILGASTFTTTLNQIININNIILIIITIILALIGIKIQKDNLPEKEINDQV